MIRPVAVASTRASVSTTLPRATLTSRAPSGIARQEGPVDQAGGRLAQRHDHHHDVVLGQQVVQLVDAVHPVHQVVPLAGPRGDRGQRHLEAGEAARDRPADRAVAEDQDALVGQRRTATDRRPTAPGPARAPSPGTRAGTPASARPPARRWTRRARRRRWRGPRRAGPGAARRRTRRSAAGPRAARAASRGARAAPGSRCTAGRRPRSRRGRGGSETMSHGTASTPATGPTISIHSVSGRETRGMARTLSATMGHALTGTARRRLPAARSAPARLPGNGAPSPTGSSASSSSTMGSLGAGSPTPGSSTGTGTSPRASASASRSPATALPTTPVTVASRLQVPWGLAFLPDGSALVTLRDEGTVLRVRADGATPVRVGTVPGVQPLGEAGLLGIAVSPRFASDHSVFVYFTAAVGQPRDADDLAGRTSFGRGRSIVDGIPKADHHDGGRLAFGPDGYLYVSTGDAGEPPCGTGPFLARRQDPAGDHGRQTGAGQPVPRVARVEPRPPQRPGHGLGRGRTHVRQRVRPGHVGRAQPHQGRGQLRLADGRGQGRPGRLHRPAGAVAHRRRLTERDRRRPRRQRLRRGPAGPRAVAGARRGRQRRAPRASCSAARYGRLRTVVTGPDGRLWMSPATPSAAVRRPTTTGSSSCRRRSGSAG